MNKVTTIEQFDCFRRPVEDAFRFGWRWCRPRGELPVLLWCRRQPKLGRAPNLFQSPEASPDWSTWTVRICLAPSELPIQFLTWGRRFCPNGFVRMDFFEWRLSESWLTNNVSSKWSVTCFQNKFRTWGVFDQISSSKWRYFRVIVEFKVTSFFNKYQFELTPFFLKCRFRHFQTKLFPISSSVKCVQVFCTKFCLKLSLSNKSFEQKFESSWPVGVDLSVFRTH